MVSIEVLFYNVQRKLVVAVAITIAVAVVGVVIIVVVVVIVILIVIGHHHGCCRHCFHLCRCCYIAVIVTVAVDVAFS